MSDLPIPPEALQDCGMVLGKRGSGKSNTLMTLLEHELAAGHRSVMIDPKGDRWMARLPIGEAAILKILADKYPDPIARDELDAPTGYKKSSRNAYIQRLQAKMLVDVNGQSITASRNLFS